MNLKSKGTIIGFPRENYAVPIIETVCFSCGIEIGVAVKTYDIVVQNLAEQFDVREEVIFCCFECVRKGENEFFSETEVIFPKLPKKLINLFRIDYEKNSGLKLSDDEVRKIYSERVREVDKRIKRKE